MKELIEKLIRYAVLAGLGLAAVGIVFLALSMTTGAGLPVQLLAAGIALLVVGMIAARILSEADVCG